MSLRTRLMLVAASAVAVAVVIASGVMYFAVRRQLRDEIDSRLRSEVVRVVSGPIDPDRFSRRAPDTPFRVDTQYFQINEADGSLVARPAGQPPIPVSRSDLNHAAKGNAYWYSDKRVNGTHVRVVGVSVDLGFNSSGVLQLARSLADVDHSLSQLRIALLLISLSGVVLAVGLGFVVARAALRPVGQLTSAVEHVTETQDLSATIEVHSDDEVGRLARSFNEMLEALDAARRQQQQLVADASHELRTPLTSLRTNIELLAMRREMPDADRERLLADVTEQLDELGLLVGDLVELAREDLPAIDGELADLWLDDLLDEAVDRARLHAPQLTIAVEANDHVLVHGHRQLLVRSFNNLLDNACKWSPPHGTVEVTATGGEVVIRDHGPGIAPEDLPHVFDRFYRAPSARSMPGSGLGLAIVRRVAELHGGQVVAEPAPGGGTRVRFRVPLVELAPGEGEGGDAVPSPDAGAARSVAAPEAPE
ncbi:MAG: HAMP domain-containing sensor histidine kinase [Acidimicrobiia bacterium]